MGSSASLSLSAVDAINFTLLSFTLITTLLRLYGRYFVFRAWGIDDILATIAFPFMIIVIVLDRERLKFGYELAEIAKTMPPSLALIAAHPVIDQFARYFFVGSFLYLFFLSFVKLSVLAFFHRIVMTRIHKFALYVTGILIIIWSICFCILQSFHVTPFAAIWRPATYRGPKTIHYSVHTIQATNASFQTLFDVLLLILPIPILSTLKVNIHIKLGLFLLYLLGSFSLVATAMRLSKAIPFSRLSGEKQIYYNPTITAWTYVEIYTVLICANLPGVAAMFRKAGKKIKTLRVHGHEGDSASIYENTDHTHSNQSKDVKDGDNNAIMENKNHEDIEMNRI